MDACLRNTVIQAIAAQHWDVVEEALTSPLFLELLAKNDALGQLLVSFSEAVARLPSDRPSRIALRLMGNTLRRDAEFIERHPEALFQCMWNSCWWCDRYEVTDHAQTHDGEPSSLRKLLEQWRRLKEKRTPGFLWLRSLRPPHITEISGKTISIKVSGEQIAYLGFSQDEETLMVVMLDGSVQYRATSTGALKESIGAPESELELLAVSPDQRLLALYNFWKRILMVAEIDRSRMIRSIAYMKNIKYQINCATFSSGGSLFAGGLSNGSVDIWGTKSARRQYHLRSSKSPIHSVSFSNDGSRILTGSDNGIVSLWDIHSERLLMNRKEHESIINNALHLPDGVHAITSGWDERTIVWDTCGHRVSKYLEGTRVRGVKGAYWARGSEFVAGWDDGTIRRWDIKRRRELSTWRPIEGTTSNYAFSNERGLAATCGHSPMIALLDVVGEHLTGIMEGHEASISGLTFSPDGTLLASSSWDCTVHVWDTTTRQRVHVFEEGRSGIESVAFSPDGSMLAAGAMDGTVYLEEVSSGSRLAALQCSQSGIDCVAFSPDGKQFTVACSDQTIASFDLKGRVLTKFRPGWRGSHKQRITALAFLCDGRRLASSSVDGRLCLWRTDNGKQLGGTRKRRRSLCWIASSPAGDELLTVYEDGIVRLWSTTGWCRARMIANPEKLAWWNWEPGFSGAVAGHIVDKEPDDPVPETDMRHNMTISDIACPADGRFVAGAAGNRAVRIWTFDRRKRVLDLYGHTSDLDKVAVSGSGRLIASSSAGGMIRLWNAPFEGNAGVLRDHEGVVTKLIVSPNGNTLISISCEDMFIWDTKTLMVNHRCRHQKGTINHAAYSPDATYIASGGIDGVINIWTVEDGECITCYREHNSSISSIAFASDSKTVASSSDEGQVFVCAINSSRILIRLDGGKTTMRSLAFSPAGDVLVGGNISGGVYAWNAISGKLLWRRTKHTNCVGCLAFTPDGTKVASGDWDGNVLLWCVRTGDVVASIQRMSGVIKRVAFSDSGRQLVVCTDSEVGTFDVGGARHAPLRPLSIQKGVPDSRPIEHGYEYMLSQIKFESVISRTDTKEVLALWPSVRAYCAHPTEPAWFGTTGGYVEAFRLEGRVDPAAADRL
jgi:WD40 repeat protein